MKKNKITCEPRSLKCPEFLHGGDYNPDQWLKYPDILSEDIRLMKLAGCNAMSVGIFSWTALEPSEGIFQFDWLDRVMDNLAEAGIIKIPNYNNQITNKAQITNSNSEKRGCFNIDFCCLFVIWVLIIVIS